MKRNWRSNFKQMAAELPVGEWFLVQFTLGVDRQAYSAYGAEYQGRDPGKLHVRTTAKGIEAAAYSMGLETRPSDTVLFVCKPFADTPLPPIPDAEVEAVSVIDLDKRPSEQAWRG